MTERIKVYTPILGVFPHHAQCSWDELQIHCDPVQDIYITLKGSSAAILGEQSAFLSKVIQVEPFFFWKLRNIHDPVNHEETM